jgi:hypothetical protein
MRVRFLLLGLVGALIGWVDGPPALSDEDLLDETGSDRKPAGIQSEASVDRDALGLPSHGPLILGSSEQGYRSEGAHFYVWQPNRADLLSWLAELSPQQRGAFRLPTDSADTAQS